MKYLKMLGLAAVAAMALMAFGAGTASATKLCTDTACGTVYAAGTEISGSLVGSAKLTVGSETVDTCTGSTVAGKTANSEGATVGGAITTLSWSSCTATTHTVALGELEIEKTAKHNEGNVFGKGSQVTVVIFGTTCTYGTGTGTKLGTITGGTEPKMNINAVGLTKTAGGFLCPTSAGWDAEYVVTKPHALYVG
jgi:hypothetical protein